MSASVEADQSFICVFDCCAARLMVEAGQALCVVAEIGTQSRVGGRAEDQQKRQNVFHRLVLAQTLIN
jgi:hypothetical protein